MSNNSKYFKVGDKVRINIHSYNIDQYFIQHPNKIYKVSVVDYHYKNGLIENQIVKLHNCIHPFEYYFNDQLIPITEDEEKICKNSKQ